MECDFERYRPYFVKVARSVGVPEIWLEDVAQEEAISVYLARGGRSSFKTVARRTAIDWMRLAHGRCKTKQPRRGRLDQAVSLEAALGIKSPDSLLEVCIIREELRLVGEAIRTLPPRQLEAVLDYLMGRTRKNDNLSHKNLSEARKKIRAYMLQLGSLPNPQNVEAHEALPSRSMVPARQLLSSLARTAS